jgi:hypothetical protein
MGSEQAPVASAAAAAVPDAPQQAASGPDGEWDWLMDAMAAEEDQSMSDEAGAAAADEFLWGYKGQPAGLPAAAAGWPADQQAYSRSHISLWAAPS